MGPFSHHTSLFMSVSEMTYTVSSGTLNSTISCHYITGMRYRFEQKLVGAEKVQYALRLSPSDGVWDENAR